MEYDVFGMCNALFDVQALVAPDLLDELGLTPGAMHLLDQDQYRALTERIRPYIANQAAGGSGANTMAGLAALGARPCFTSCVGRDEFGDAYERSLYDAGVQPFLGRKETGTGMCAVLVTPGGQRTMGTYLGAGRSLGTEDVNTDAIRSSRFLYFTGYLWDTPSQKEAVLAAMEAARANHVPVALSLADRFCVERNREDFLRLLGESVDIVFGNEDEALFLTQAATTEEAVCRLSEMTRLAFVTLGALGAIVAREGQVHRIPAEPVHAVDTTGAGDAFAAGTLFALSRGYAVEDAARLGCRLAGKVVSSLGPRPDPAAASEILR